MDRIRNYSEEDIEALLNGHLGIEISDMDFHVDKYTPHKMVRIVYKGDILVSVSDSVPLKLAFETFELLIKACSTYGKAENKAKLKTFLEE